MKKVNIYILIAFLILISCKKDESSNINLAIVETSPITDITESTAVSGGNITDDGGGDIIDRGVCISTDINPTIDESRYSGETTTSVYSCNINNLEPNTQYYIRAYASNSAGTSYGNELDFKTQYAENIYTGDVVLTTQQEVNNFGSNKYTAITGSLTIGDWNNPSENILDLNSLNSLKIVGNDLTITNNEKLTFLSGLDNIISVGGLLYIHENPLLGGLSALNNLNDIGGSIKIIDNDSINNIPEFDSLAFLNGDLIIGGNKALTHFSGLNNLTSISGDIRIVSNEKLSRIDLDNLTNVGGYLGIWSNFRLSNLGLNNLVSIGGYLSIYNNINLRDITTLSDLTIVGGYLQIEDNGLRDIAGFSNLSSIGKFIKIHSNIYLTSISGFENLNSVGEYLWIKFNYDLTYLCGIQPLIVNNGLVGSYLVNGNAYNPTKQDIIDGNCSQ